MSSRTTRSSTRKPSGSSSQGGGKGGGTKGGGAQGEKREQEQQQRDRSGKKAEDLVEEVEVMADKAGVKMPKEKGKKDEETLEAVKHSRERRYRDYSKQAALQELKEKHDVGKPKGKGDPFSLQEAKVATSGTKRGRAPPLEEEKNKPPTRRKTRSGAESAMSHVLCEENRGLADALYELAQFAIHGDALQKGLTYQKAAKSVREAPEPIKSKKEAQKLPGIGRSLGEKVEEFLTSGGKITVLEEYRKGQRGL